MPHLPKVLRFSLPNNPQTHKSYAGPVVITCYFLPSFNLSGNNTASLIICPLIFDTHASALIEYYGYLSYLETIFIAMIHHLYLEGITVSFYPFEVPAYNADGMIKIPGSDYNVISFPYLFRQRKEGRQ